LKKSISVPLTTTLPVDEPAGEDIAYELPFNSRRLPRRYWNHWWASSAGTGDPGRRLGEGWALGAGEITAEVLGAGLEAVPLEQDIVSAAVTTTVMNAGMDRDLTGAVAVRGS
jgi:hypothetical protein